MPPKKVASKDYEGKVFAIKKGKTLDHLVLVPAGLNYFEVRDAATNKLQEAKRTLLEMQTVLGKKFAPHASAAKQKLYQELEQFQRYVSFLSRQLHLLREIYLDAEDERDDINDLMISPEEYAKLAALRRRRRRKHKRRRS
jgi:hypothetical protein